MKKILFLSLLGFPILFLWGCSLINKNDNWTNTWDIEKISQLEKQLSGLLEQFSWLQEENQMLKSNQENTNTTSQNNTNVKNNKIYSNTTYDFNLTFPNTRSWYITNTNWNKINFWFHEQMPLLTITALTNSERNNIQNDLMKPTYLWKNSNYVFVYSTAQDAINQTIINRMGEINNIIQTFNTN